MNDLLTHLVDNAFNEPIYIYIYIYIYTPGHWLSG